MVFYAHGLVDMVADPTEGYDVAWLGDMDVTKTTCGWAGHQNTANVTIDGNPITMKDTIYTSGVCVHATGKIIVKLNGATRFVCTLGMDDEVLSQAEGDTRYGVADYRVVLQGGDGSTETVAEGTVKATDANTVKLDVNTSGWKYIILESNEGAQNWADHVNWANAYFEYMAKAATPPYIVGEEEMSAKLLCANIVFSQPGVRFMQKVKAVSSSATVTAENLPAELTWNAERNLVEGTINEEGTYTYNFVVDNDGDTTTETVTLTVSSNLQQPVPFMGWLSWNVYMAEFGEEEIKATGEAMVRHGLLDAGYNYLCIDDNWHADTRDPETGAPRYDTTKFPSGLPAITNYAHSLGLKIGIYSDAAEKTCNQEFGSLGYEEIDARTYAEWGFDLLKYDYCYAPSDVETAQVRYQAMGDALRNCGRDILFYMCEWGQRDPWLWGAETGATCWRATYDSRDQWDAGRYNGSNCGVIQAIDVMKHISVYSGPNRYNDADMMCVGLYGEGIPSSELQYGTPGMTFTEYQSQFAMWCMFASPLTISFDITGEIPERDLELITNEELIAIDQDRMGQQADLIVSNDNYEIYSKDLENGDIAVAVLNRSGATRNVTIDFSLLPLEAGVEYDFRDLWAHESVGKYKDEYTVSVESHQTLVYRVSRADATTGIESLAGNATAGDIEVSTSAGNITVSCPATQGKSKRVLISDLSGRVVAQTTSTTETITLPFRAPNGIYVANVVCAGKASNVKFEKR